MVILLLIKALREEGGWKFERWRRWGGAVSTQKESKDAKARERDGG